MKIFPAVFSTVAASYEQPKYDAFLQRVVSGEKSAGWGHPVDKVAALWSLCPAMTPPQNGQIVCDQSTCALVCDDGFIPMSRRRTKCRWNSTKQFFWKRTLSDCDTCTDLPSPPAGITADCGINAIRKKKCLYKCDNGSEISTAAGDFLQFSAVCGCPRPDRICRWKSRKVGVVDSASIAGWTCPNPTVPTTTTQAPATTTSTQGATQNPTNPPTSGCDASKPSTCTSLTTAEIGLENEWSCRNCFRINAHYQLPATWQDTDFVTIKFKIPVTWSTFSHPIDNVQALDSGLTWRINFATGANFESGMMFDANLMALQTMTMSNSAVFEEIKSCPCTNTSVGTTTASPGGGATTTQAPGPTTTTQAPGPTTTIQSPGPTTTQAPGPTTTQSPAPTTTVAPCTPFNTLGSFTHYDLRDNDIENGACGLMWSGSNLGTTMFVALDQDTDYDSNRNCGRCIKMKCECTQSQFPGACAAGQETIAIVADNCPDAGCHQGHVDSSTWVWNSVSGNEAPSIYDGSWEFVECPVGFVPHPVSQIRFKTGSSQFWMAIQPSNHKFGIVKMSINGVDLPNGGVTGAVGENYYYIADGIVSSFPFTIEIENTNGETASATINSAAEIGDNFFVDLDALV